MHSDYYNMVFGEKLANILYEANSQFFYERNVIEEAVNALFCEREIINNKNIIKKLGNDSNLLIVFYVQIMPDDFVMQLHRF
ncbi:putative phosphatidate cytidylyltransferase [Escherichia coli]|nr:putative phosphatidate cytidylyltransferase [Escherichia coli]CTW75064.1 putative phosphatidate cytidylyltransferase [Escherichia coli]CTZ37103.1 putative phosphatidate cytidylyltransferase [Escherichia coli]CTZ67066.1 putative phosphatidate cytidylyltransferase [Escherichia coli]